MSESVSNSFIPKRNPGTKPRQVRTRNVFILSAISYALFISAPLASAGVFIYKLQAEKNATTAIKALDEAIATFDEADFKRVIEYEERLNRAEFLVDSHISMSSLLRILSDATAQTVQFKDLEIERADKDTVKVKAAIRTSSLDGVLFQRGQYKATTKIADTNLNKITFGTVETTAKDAVTSAGDNTVSLTAEFTFTADEIRYTPLSVYNSANSVQTTVPQSDTGTSTLEDTNNETS